MRAAPALKPLKKTKPKAKRLHPAVLVNGPLAPVMTAAAVRSSKSRVDQLAAVAEELGPWRPAGKVIHNVRAVPTCFAQFDAATGIGGFPVGRIGLVHGPSNHGKTEFMIGLLASYLRAGHFAGLIDAERTTAGAERWVRSLMGELVDAPAFSMLHASSYEKTAQAVRDYAEAIGKARAEGRIPEDTTALLAVDSIRKLMPADLMKRLAQDVGEGSGAQRGKRQGIDGYGGRAAQIKAALNAAWMDELVPLLADTGTSMLIISREEVADDDVYVDKPKIGGGRALFYESSLVIRVTGAPIIMGEKKEARVVGEVHTVQIRKTKVGQKIERYPVGNYHTSNGLEVPAGFWPARDVLELAVELGAVQQRGAFFSFGQKRLGQGRDAALERLQSEPELLAAVEAAARALLVKD